MTAKLRFTHSTMNAGKTAQILLRNHAFTSNGFSPILYTYSGESKTGCVISSRVGLYAPAKCFDEKTDFYVEITNAMYEEKKDIGCVFVDEAQFLTRSQVRQLSNVVDYTNISVHCYGLHINFKGDPFEGSSYLFAEADEIDELESLCHCGQKATHVLKISRYGNPIYTGPTIDIGQEGKYVSVCRLHWKEGRTK